jgi:hypothetical protein
MMNLPKKQLAMLILLYKNYKDTGKRTTFVSGKGVSSSTMKSFYKSKLIESDRVVQDVPANMRINDAGIKTMEDYYEHRKNTIERILNRNKQFMRFVQNTEEKRLVLFNYLIVSPMIKSNIEVIHRGYGVFEAINTGTDEQYYGVYDLTEGNSVEIGGCVCREINNKKYYIEMLKTI